MQLPRSSVIPARFETRAESPSTNTELATLAVSDGWPDFSVLVTDSQTNGRGRLGRSWVAPAGKTLAVSILLRPRLADGSALAVERFGWFPLLAGMAMTAAVRSLGIDGTNLKWPNDVLVHGRKIAGLLAELLPTGDGVVLGAGLNLSFTEDDLPVPTATSIAIEGGALSGDELADAALAAYLSAFRDLYSRFLSGGADADATGIRPELVGMCSTIGLDVKVELPSGDDLLGTAVGIDETGRLQVRRRSDAGVQAVAAGDVTHLRYE